MSSESPTITYTEPSLPSLLTLVAFLYLLQVSRFTANKLFSAGLLGEIALGIVFGSPLAGILDRSWEQTFMFVGYWGLILIVFEGGLDFNPQLFIPALPLATVTALTGVLLPIAFSFAILSAAFGYSNIYSLTCGAALASTSLGTTFFVLRSQTSKFDLGNTRIGSVLTGAALVDDIIALVLLSVIKSLGTGSSRKLGWTVGHPIVASIALPIVGPAITYFVLRPLYRRFLERLVIHHGSKATILFSMCVLCAYLSIAYYIGTTVLLGAFLAGVTLAVLPASTESEAYISVFQRFVGPVQEFIFAPLFFASIGYSIPFLDLFTVKRVWQGLVFSIFMAIGKLLVGLWIPLSEIRIRGVPHAHPGMLNIDLPITDRHSKLPETRCKTAINRSLIVVWPSQASLMPALMLGSAMVARGEIGILILQVAYSLSINSTSGSFASPVISQDVYLIGIWAVLLCTIIGPIAFSHLLDRCTSDSQRLGLLTNSRWGQGVHTDAVDTTATQSESR